MGLRLKITCFLLLVQAFHLALLQDSTDSPGRTISKGWLRDRVERRNSSQNSVEEDGMVTGSGNEDSSGRPSGFTVQHSEEELETENDEASDDTTAASFTTLATNYTGRGEVELTNTTGSSSASPANASKINTTVAEDHFDNSTTTSPNPTTNETITPISTGVPKLSNHTDVGTTNATTQSKKPQEQEATTEPDTLTGSADGAESKTTVSTTEDTEGKKTSSSTTPFPKKRTEPIPVTTTTTAASTTKEANLTDKDGASGGNSERGFASDLQTRRRHRAWGAVLGTAVAVALVGLVVYIILKKKSRKGFSHRKLIEEFPTDPVLKLDNSEPLNLNYGGSAYYNPGLQGDNIQMSDFPRGHTN